MSISDIEVDCEQSWEADMLDSKQENINVKRRLLISLMM